MTIEHVDIQDGERHEPKGISTASNKQVYVADGLGSGAWADSTISVHGQMSITNNTTVQAVTAAVDATLNTDTDYIKMTGAAFPWASVLADGVTFSTDKFVLGSPGYYIVSFWGTLKIANTNTFVGVKYALNDATPYSLHKLKVQSTSANDYKTIGATELIGPVNTNDTLSLYIASTVSTNVTLEEAGLLVNYVHA